MKPLILTLVVILAGCVTTKPMTTPNGKQGYHIDCGGTTQSWNDCYEAAAKACNGPYGIVDRTGSSTATAYGPLLYRELMVECRS